MSAEDRWYNCQGDAYENFKQHKSSLCSPVTAITHSFIDLVVFGSFSILNCCLLFFLAWVAVIACYGGKHLVSPFPPPTSSASAFLFFSSHSCCHPPIHFFLFSLSFPFHFLLLLLTPPQLENGPSNWHTSFRRKGSDTPTAVTSLYLTK